jgi:hypothetical protein
LNRRSEEHCTAWLLAAAMLPGVLALHRARGLDVAKAQLNCLKRNKSIE